MFAFPRLGHLPRVLSTALLFVWLPVAGTPSIVHPEVASGRQVHLDAKLSGSPKVGSNVLTLTLTDESGKPVSGAKVELSVSMTAMDMGTAHPKAIEKAPGTYEAAVEFAMSGGWRVTCRVSAPGQEPFAKSFDFSPGDSMTGMGAMKSSLGDWGMQRDGSGTSWLPDSSPMFMKELPRNGRYDLSVMGSFSLNYSSTNGPRGDHRFFSNSMPMLMAQRETGGGTIALDLMVSLDPIFNGEFGYPDLFQTGETAYGKPLVDYQHPHNLVSEVAGSYSHPIGGGMNAFVYGGPVGEPALGGPMFMHRPSGMEIPEAPISHHWFDSTHISYGVITAGLNSRLWQVEGSVFNGHEPGENRYSPDPIGLNSASARLTYNPVSQISLSTSYGYLNSPESTSPGIDQHRLTGSAIWSLPFKNGDNLSVSALFGRIMQEGTTSDAYVLETTLFQGENAWFVRWENVDKDELVGVPPGGYRINKVLFGDVTNFVKTGGFDVGLGGYMGLYAYPSSLDPYYGHSPVTLGVFLRIRPGRMRAQ